MDPHLPKVFGNTLKMAILADSNHAHDCHLLFSHLFDSIVGSNPVEWFPKCPVASSTYHAKLSALCTSVEEAQSLCYNS